MGRPAPTFALKTLGCRVNQADSDEIVHLLVEAGMDLVDFGAPADVVIVNTCTVTHVADRKSRQAIGRALRRSPEAELVVTGCYASVAPEAVRAHFPGARVMGRLPPGEVAAAIAGDRPSSGRARATAESGFGERRRTRPTVKVQEGCRHGCAFCIVPRARGGPRSRTCGQVLERVRGLCPGRGRGSRAVRDSAGQLPLPGQRNRTGRTGRKGRRPGAGAHPALFHRTDGF